VRFDIGEILHKETRFKNLEGKFRKKISKRTIYTSGGLELLQLVLELDTRRCASEDVKPRRGWTPSSVPARMLGTEEG